MKADKQTTNGDTRQVSLEHEVNELLDHSTANLPASIVHRLRADRSNALDMLMNEQSSWRNPFDWRPAIAAATLAALAIVMLYLPNQVSHSDFNADNDEQSWLAGDDYFSGDDLSLYLWLSETGELEGNIEG